MNAEQNNTLTATYKEIGDITKMLGQVKKLKNQPLQSEIHALLIDELKSKHNFINQVIEIAKGDGHEGYDGN